MSWVVGLPNNSCKPITNTAWGRALLCKLQKGCTRLAEASDKVYQLLAHGRWFSPASSTTKTGRHIAKILLKVSLNTINKSINLSFKCIENLLPIQCHGLCLYGFICYTITRNLFWNFEDWSKHPYKYHLLVFLDNHLVITFISPVF